MTTIRSKDLRIHHIVTGELESSLGVSLFNGGAFPGRTLEQRLPYGFRNDLRRSDGTIVSGVMVPVPVWYIEGTERKILIDSGLGDCAQVAAVQHAYGIDFICERKKDQDLVAGLRAIGVDPKDIDIVVLTHLHFDHFGNNEIFEKATFIVQRDELGVAIAPPAYGGFYYRELAGYLDPVRDRIEAIEGDIELERGVRLVKIGGHSPGCMVTYVETALGIVALTSDVMYNYRNLELNWPMGAYWNLQELMNGYARIRSEADVIVPNHDWQVRVVYPDGVIG